MLVFRVRVQKGCASMSDGDEQQQLGSNQAGMRAGTDSSSACRSDTTRSASGSALQRPTACAMGQPDGSHRPIGGSLCIASRQPPAKRGVPTDSPSLSHTTDTLPEATRFPSVQCLLLPPGTPFVHCTWLPFRVNLCTSRRQSRGRSVSTISLLSGPSRVWTRSGTNSFSAVPEQPSSIVATCLLGDSTHPPSPSLPSSTQRQSPSP